MKNFINIILISFILNGCQSEKQKAEKTAIQYLEYLKEKNYENAKKLQTEECELFLGCATEMGMDFGITEIKDMECVVRETEARCDFCCSDSSLLDNFLMLQKRGDKWLIHCPKEIPPCYNDSTNN